MTLARMLITYSVHVSAYYALVHMSVLQALIHQSSPPGAVLSSTQQCNVVSCRQHQVISLMAAAICQHCVLRLLTVSRFFAIWQHSVVVCTLSVMLEGASSIPAISTPY